MHTSLPIEIMQFIIDQTDLRTLITCRAVSKSIRKSIENQAMNYFASFGFELPMSLSSEMFYKYIAIKNHMAMMQKNVIYMPILRYGNVGYSFAKKQQCEGYVYEAYLQLIRKNGDVLLFKIDCEYTDQGSVDNMIYCSNRIRLTYEESITAEQIYKHIAKIFGVYMFLSKTRNCPGNLYTFINKKYFMAITTMQN